MNRDWRPSCGGDMLHQRAELLRKLRDFFHRHNILEVDVPVLGMSTVTDPHIQSLSTECGEQRLYLQTSPEFAMKRLLATYKHSIYYLGKAFRRGEMGAKHNPEFTLLEWYHLGFDDRDLMAEVQQLLHNLKPDLEFSTRSYAELFQSCVGINPHKASAQDLSLLAREKIDCSDLKQDKNAWLDLLFTHLVEPQLQGITFVVDYPASQAALAKIALDTQGNSVAKRFEVFWNNMELGNGYWELTDPQEQKQRFQEDNQVRAQLDLPTIHYDRKLIAALDQGLPECAGIAMGVDRLLMCLTEMNSIDQVMPFAINRA